MLTSHDRSFLIQVPIVVLGLLDMIFLYEEDKRPKRDWKLTLKRVDFLGAALIIIAVSTLLYALDAGAEKSWSSAPILGCLLVSALAFLAFGFVEEKVASEPFMPRRVIWSRTAIACMICNFLIFAWWLSVLFYLPLLWEVNEASSGSAVALRLLPAIIAGVLASLVAGLVRLNILHRECDH